MQTSKRDEAGRRGPARGACPRTPGARPHRAEDFAALDATVVGISSQDLASHEGFVSKYSLNVPLLADVDKQVARKYDAFSQRLGVKRAVIVIDEDGIVRHRHDHLLGLDYQSVDELKATLDALPGLAA